MSDNSQVLRALRTIEKVANTRSIAGNVNNADVVIVYGDIKGNVYDCDNVIVINGDVNGNITLCDNVAGLLADKAVRCHVGGADE